MTGRLRIPAEWERHAACWLGFPYLAAEWPGTLDAAQAAIEELCRAIAGPGDEPVRLLVKDEAVESVAQARLGDVSNVELVRFDYGDSWLRDTAPLFGRDEAGVLGGLCFDFNGWGGKYAMPFDDTLAVRLARRVGARAVPCPVTLEGGSLELDGEGTALTTASCVLNGNRNPGLTREAFEALLKERTTVERVVWLDRGLHHDHTDGHIDMVARFCGPGRVACMVPDESTANPAVLERIAEELVSAGYELVELPGPPILHDRDDAPLPASYCNFYVANAAVIVPTYEVPQDSIALARLADAFPGREVVGLSAYDLLCGGGAFHCVTQPQPADPE